MFSKFKYLIIFQAIILGSCGVSEEQKQDILETHIQELRDVRVEKFDITECLTECQMDTGKLINQILDFNILKLEIGHWMNCETSSNNSIGGFEYKNGVLNLLIKGIPERVDIEENGDTSFYYLAAACDCYFIFNFELTGFEEIPDSILIDNEPINNHGLMAGMFVGLEDNVIPTDSIDRYH